MALIRIRDYAAAHGVTPAAIYLAIENGLIEATRGLLSIVHQLNAGLLAMSRDADPLIAEAGRIGLLELAGLQDESLQVTRQE